MAPDSSASPPLTGLRVLDLTSELGAVSTRFMAGMGADVVRVEPPRGHLTRRRGPFWHGIPDPERSLYWFQMNAGKRGVTLNLATTDGRELFLALAAKAHFVVESLPVGALTSYGLGYDELAAANPELVLTSISPFGQTGPLADVPASDLIGLAAGGLLYLCGDIDRPPVRVTVEQAYAQAGIHAAAATMVAHHRRQRTGRGTHVDVSMQECIVWALANNRLLWTATNVITHRAGGGRAGGAGARLIYETADGYLAFYRRPENNVAVQRWLDDLGISLPFDVAAWQSLPRDGDGAPPVEQIQQLEAALAEYFATRPKAELMREGQRRGLYIAEASTPRDLVESEHLRERCFWEAIAHPDLGATITYPGAPFRMAKTPWHVERPAPRLGEHNREILCGDLGLSEGELVMLKSVGVV